MFNKSSVIDRYLISREGYGCEEVVPRGYVSLMDLYENNFIRFKKLVPRIEEIQQSAVSRIPGCLDVHIEVIERSEYTTTLCMTYLFDDGKEDIAEPDLKLRVYHDAGLVEVVAGHLKHGRQRLEHLPATALKLKWRLNRFLYKWLGYCLHLGHEFTTETADFEAEKVTSKRSV
jgi:uncharacterized protein YqiB (DUF1249 family)